MFGVQVSLQQATKAQRGSRRIALLFLQPRRSMGMGRQRHAPAALPPGKNRYPLYRRLGGPQGLLNGCGKPRPQRDSIPGPSTPQQVALPTELSRPTSWTRAVAISADSMRTSGVETGDIWRILTKVRRWRRKR